jgi:hypothetical protein
MNNVINKDLQVPIYRELITIKYRNKETLTLRN